MQGILLLIKKPQNLPLLVLHLTFRQISMNSDRHLALSAFLQSVIWKTKKGKRQNWESLTSFPLIFISSIVHPRSWAVSLDRGSQFPNCERGSLKLRMIFRAGQLPPPPRELVMAFVNWGACSLLPTTIIKNRFKTEVPPSPQMIIGSKLSNDNTTTLILGHNTCAFQSLTIFPTRLHLESGQSDDTAKKVGRWSHLWNHPKRKQLTITFYSPPLHLHHRHYRHCHLHIAIGRLMHCRCNSSCAQLCNAAPALEIDRKFARQANNVLSQNETHITSWNCHWAFALWITSFDCQYWCTPFNIINSSTCKQYWNVLPQSCYDNRCQDFNIHSNSVFQRLLLKAD